ncbi:hypothetical protein [Jannaschia sp. M317]|uniref:hypothetical protein n=1 Tax=Jannaschia sp. M317 TaxID=2867011 RepID=UPI0021A36A70|nr:hypothetical protein [Jannaschia sp. M317]UWQ17995.1 hypothetical protein K3551_01420 [Jannaschia sp. M317]
MKRLATALALVIAAGPVLAQGYYDPARDMWIKDEAAPLGSTTVVSSSAPIRQVGPVGFTRTGRTLRDLDEFGGKMGDAGENATAYRGDYRFGDCPAGSIITTFGTCARP